jgi:hypothetical protein
MNPHTQQDITDAILDLPQSFTVEGVRYTLTRPTLGKALLTARIIAELEINGVLLQKEPTLEVFRLISAHRQQCCQFITYYTLQGKQECANAQLINKRTEELAIALDDDDLATLLLMVLTMDKDAQIMKELGIEADRNEQQRIYNTRDTKGAQVIAFGGHSIYGQLLDKAAERYGWSKDYIVWGIDLTSLRLMLEDAVTSVHLTSDEAKRARISTDRVRVNMDDAEAAKQFVKSHKWN